MVYSEKSMTRYGGMEIVRFFISKISRPPMGHIEALYHKVSKKGDKHYGHICFYYSTFKLKKL